jgi:hypothetical protein
VHFDDLASKFVDDLIRQPINSIVEIPHVNHLKENENKDIKQKKLNDGLVSQNNINRRGLWLAVWD